MSARPGGGMCHSPHCPWGLRQEDCLSPEFWAAVRCAFCTALGIGMVTSQEQGAIRLPKEGWPSLGQKSCADEEVSGRYYLCLQGTDVWAFILVAVVSREHKGLWQLPAQVAHMCFSWGAHRALAVSVQSSCVPPAACHLILKTHVFRGLHLVKLIVFTVLSRKRLSKGGLLCFCELWPLREEWLSEWPRAMASVLAWGQWCPAAAPSVQCQCGGQRRRAQCWELLSASSIQAPWLLDRSTHQAWQRLTSWWGSRLVCKLFQQLWLLKLLVVYWLFFFSSSHLSPPCFLLPVSLWIKILKRFFFFEFLRLFYFLLPTQCQWYSAFLWATFSLLGLLSLSTPVSAEARDVEAQPPQGIQYC